MAYDRPPNCPDLRMGGVYAGVPENGHPWVGVGHRILGMEVSIVERSGGCTGIEKRIDNSCNNSATPVHGLCAVSQLSFMEVNTIHNLWTKVALFFETCTTP